MSERDISRRDFFRRSAGGTVLAGTAVGLTTSAEQARASGRPARKGQEKVTEVPSICEMCFWRCGILGQVKDGKLLGLRGNPDHPLSQGHLCARGNAGWLLHTDPDRLTHPLIRTGKRGEGKFREASWGEALDLVATRMLQIRKKHGPAAMALAPHGMSTAFMKAVFKHYGSATFSAASFGQCRGPRIAAFKHTFGLDPGSPERLDFDRTRLIVLIGSHIGENVHTSQVHAFASALDRGAHLVVVDPRFSVAASKAQVYLPIKPGTDTALLLAWIHVLLRDGTYDKAYIAANAVGLDKLQAHVQKCTPEWASRITEIPAAQIEQTARMMAAAKPAVIVHPGRATTWYGNDQQRERALAILVALLGAWGRPGGYFLPSRVPLGKCTCEPRITPQTRFPMPDGKYPLAEEGLPSEVLINAMLTDNPVPVKGLMIYGQNIIRSWPRPDVTRKALARTEFVVTVDILPTEPVLWADVVLPEAAYLERYDPPHKVGSALTPYVALRQPIVPPPGEARAPFDIARGLALRLGLHDCMTCPNVELLLDRAMVPLGVSLETLKHDGIVRVKPGRTFFPEGRPGRFFTRSGKIELYSESLEKEGVAPLPRYQPTPDPPKGMFRLLYGRSPAHSFGRSQNNRLLVEIDPVNRLWINDRVAKRLGIREGDEVELVNAEGKATGSLPAKVTPGIRSDCVFMVHGFGSRSRLLRLAHARGASDTEMMTHDTPDADTGASSLRTTFVRVRKAKRPRRWPRPLASLRPQRTGAVR